MGRSRLPCPPAHPAALIASVPQGSGHTERPPYLCALRQQALEGRPELFLKDLLQLPGQHLSWFPGSLSRDGGRGRSAILHWPPARHGQPARPPEPQAD